MAADTSGPIRPFIEGWAPEVSQALHDAYAKGFWDGAAARASATVLLPDDWKQRGLDAGQASLGDETTGNQITTPEEGC